MELLARTHAGLSAVQRCREGHTSLSRFLHFPIHRLTD